VLLEPLTVLADKLGRLSQYSHQGFFSNARQQRASGYAAIELAQVRGRVGIHPRERIRQETSPDLIPCLVCLSSFSQAIRSLLAARRSGNTVWVRSEGSSVQAGASGRHQFGWRDAMDIVVKWRQLSEPNDQVGMIEGEGTHDEGLLIRQRASASLAAGSGAERIERRH